MEIRTERLKIYLATEKEMQDLIDKTENSELKTAYKEMLNGAIINHEQKEFYAMWFITLLTGEHIGEMCFKGVNNGKTEIGYGIEEKFQNNGYGTESVTALTGWALSQKSVKKVIAEVENDNIFSIKLLEKVGFSKTKTLKNGNIFFEKSKR